MPWFTYLWAWHPEQIRALRLGEFWLYVDLAEQIKHARAKAAST